MDTKYAKHWLSGPIQNVVVDGQAFAIHMYELNCDWKLGGDYTKFAGHLDEFLIDLKVREVNAFFIFDGSIPIEKMNTKKRREEAKMRTTQAMLFPGSRWEQDSESEPKGPTPPLIVDVCKSALDKHGFPFTTSDEEADMPVVGAAISRDAFVVSNDSDLMLVCGPKGFVRCSDFCRGESSVPFLPVGAVCDALRLPQSLLPALSTLTGNDYVAHESLQRFHTEALREYAREGNLRERRSWTVLEAVAAWLRKGRTLPPGDVDMIEDLWRYSLKSYEHRGTACDISDSTAGERTAPPDAPTLVPSELVHPLRHSPTFPRQLVGILIGHFHLSPVLVEPLSEASESVWCRSIPIRAAAVQALGRDEWEDSFIKVESGEVKIGFRTIRVREIRGLPFFPRGVEARDATVSYFCHALGWSEEGLERLDRFGLPKGRWLQFIALRYWVVGHSEHEGGALQRWMDVATALLLLVLPPQQRRLATGTASIPQVPEPALARRFAALQGCILSTMTLHEALGSPLDATDLEHVYDGPFMHAMAGGKKIDTERILPIEFRQLFDGVLRCFLESLSGAARPKFDGGAQRAGDNYHFSRRITVGGRSGSSESAQSESDIALSKRRKALEKKLKQINDLERKPKFELSAEESAKVAQKVQFETELDSLGLASQPVDILESWGVI